MIAVLSWSRPISEKLKNWFWLLAIKMVNKHNGEVIYTIVLPLGKTKIQVKKTIGVRIPDYINRIDLFVMPRGYLPRFQAKSIWQGFWKSSPSSRQPIVDFTHPINKPAQNPTYPKPKIALLAAELHCWRATYLYILVNMRERAY